MLTIQITDMTMITAFWLAFSRWLAIIFQLPFNYFPYLDWFMDTPARLVIWAAFGVPPFFFLFALLGKFFKNGNRKPS